MSAPAHPQPHVRSRPAPVPAAAASARGWRHPLALEAGLLDRLMLVALLLALLWLGGWWALAPAAAAG